MKIYLLNLLIIKEHMMEILFHYIIYILIIHYAGDKPSSAVSKLYEIMKLRDDVYDRSSRYPVENKSISNIVDKATSTVGPEVSIKIFGDERRPINNGPVIEINYDEQLSKKFKVEQIIDDNLDDGVLEINNNTKFAAIKLCS